MLSNAKRNKTAKRYTMSFDLTLEEWMSVARAISLGAMKLEQRANELKEYEDRLYGLYEKEFTMLYDLQRDIELDCIAIEEKNNG